MDVDPKDVTRKTMFRFDNGARLICVSIIAGTSLAFLLPDQGISDNPAINAFTSRMMDMIPSIERIARWSIHPRLSELLLSIMWLTLPFQTIAFLVVPGVFRLNMAYVRKRPWFVSISIIVLPVAATVAMVFLGGGPPEENQTNLISDVVARNMQSSKFWLGAISGLMISGLALIYAGVIRIVPVMTQVLLSKDVKGKTGTDLFK